MSGKKLVIYSDGASRGNPGPAGIGIVICDERGEVVKEYDEFIGTTTNNVAEYRALLKALELASNFPINELECFSDSELMIKQLNGDYAVKNPRLHELVLQVREKEKDFGRVRYVHVSREDARIMKTDQLANRAIEKESKR
jgi:ribonuclease HI